MKFRTAYTKRDPALGSQSFVGVASKTQQQFRDECNINSIMARYESTGVMPQPWRNPPRPQWGDFASAPDFQAAQDLILRARDQFASLPAKVRTRFNQDPVALMRFLADPANRDEAVALGLKNPVAPPEPPPAPSKDS